MNTKSHLAALEAERTHNLREVVVEFENPVKLYTIGKDSVVMLHLEIKAFYPCIPPCTIMQVDTLWKFRDMSAMIDQITEKHGLQLLVLVSEGGRVGRVAGVHLFTQVSKVGTDIMRTGGLSRRRGAGVNKVSV